MTEDKENEINRDIARRTGEIKAQYEKEAGRYRTIIVTVLIVVGLVLYFFGK